MDKVTDTPKKIPSILNGTVESAVKGVTKSDPVKLRELGHRCVCDVGSGVIVLDRYFFRSEKGSIDRFFQVMQFKSAEIGGQVLSSQ